MSDAANKLRKKAWKYSIRFSVKYLVRDPNKSSFSQVQATVGHGMRRERKQERRSIYDGCEGRWGVQDSVPGWGGRGGGPRTISLLLSSFFPSFLLTCF